MADQRRDPEHGPRRKPCSRRRGARRARVGKLRDLRRRRARRRQDLRNAAAAPTPARRTATTSSSASSRPTAGARPRRCSRASKSSRASASTTRARSLEEMDLDAHHRAPAADRAGRRTRPHQCAEGSRHPKRYLDVEELMDRGIDVYTTVNIQHIESLNDVVAQITHVRVRETVPDAVFDRADAIELVDLTPDDLIQRLKEGKVYVPKQAERALEHFFSPANLTALRELALRRTAERVDEQLLTRNAGARHPGPVGGGRAHSGLHQRGSALRRPGALRQAARRPSARAMGRRSISRAGAACSSPRRSATASPTRCGSPRRSAARRSPFPASDRRIADDVIGYAQANNVTQIIIGKSARTRWFEILHGSVVHDLVRRSGNISVHVIAGDELAGEPIAEEDGARRPRATSRSIRGPMSRRWSRSPWRSVSARTDRSLGRHRQCRPGLSDRGRGDRRSLRPVAVAARQRRRLARLQFLLPAADLHLHHHRSAPTSRRSAFSCWSRSSSPTSPRGGAPRRSRRWSARAPPSRSTPSAASSPAPARSTTCCGRPPIRPR